MKQKDSNNITVKSIILIIVSVGIGTFISNILGNIEINIWFARISGAFATVIVALILHYILIKKTK